MTSEPTDGPTEPTGGMSYQCLSYTAYTGKKRHIHQHYKKKSVFVSMSKNVSQVCLSTSRGTNHDSLSLSLSGLQA